MRKDPFPRLVSVTLSGAVVWQPQDLQMGLDRAAPSVRRQGVRLCDNRAEERVGEKLVGLPDLPPQVQGEQAVPPVEVGELPAALLAQGHEEGRKVLEGRHRRQRAKQVRGKDVLKRRTYFFFSKTCSLEKIVNCGKEFAQVEIQS